MVEKMYLNLLLLCGIFSQGIIGTFADEDIRKSSAIVVRQKRVISHVPDEDIKMPIHKVRYIVHIKHFMRIKCVGSILSRHVVITVPACVPYAPQEYHVVSGSSRSSRGDFHNVTAIKRQFDNLPNRHLDGVALLTVDMPFVNPIYAKPIELHSEPLLPGKIATVSGWGYICGKTAERGTKHPVELRSIEVPILAHRECVNIYRAHGIEISEKDICTFDQQRHCGHNDAGAPLVVDGYLAGIHLWTGLTKGQYDPEFPEVFAFVQDPVYKQWITSSVQSIEAHL